MRWLVSLVVIMLLAVALALAARYAQGYVLFVMPRTRVEMSLTLFVLLAALALALCYTLVRSARHMWQLPARVKAYRLHRSRNRARGAMQEAMSAYLEGHFERAERAAAKAMRLQEAPELATALAAQAAHAQGLADKSEQYLAFGNTEAKQPSTLLQVTRANLLHQRGEHEEALKLAERIIAASPKHVPALRLSLQCHQSLQHWAEVERIAAELSRHGHAHDPAVDEALQAAARRARDVATHVPAEAASPGDIIALRPRRGSNQ